MDLSRREFIDLLAGVGVSVALSTWLADRVAALAATDAIAVAPGPGAESWIRTACGLCQGGCGLEARLIDGLPVGVRGDRAHLVNRGRSCALPHAAVPMLFGPDRVQRPLRRVGRRGQGDWAELSWDEAELLVVERLRQLVAARSPERIAFLDGRLDGLGRLIAENFLYGLGSSNFIPARPAPGDELARAMFGWERAPGADLENARVVLLFRFDHLETDGSPVWQSRVYSATRDRTTDRPIYVSIGSRLLGSAAKSDHWLAARPGTEALVALAMARVILDEGWEDRGFLEMGSDWPRDDQPAEVAALLRAVNLDVAAEVSGVSQREIEQAAAMFAEHQPGVALAGPGTAASPSGRMLLWATSLLNVLVGAVGRRGGLVGLSRPPLTVLRDPPVARRPEPRRRPAITETAQLAHALRTSDPAPVDLLFVRDANPVFDSPLARAFRQGLRPSDRMIVVFATELDETAQLADLVIPEPTFLERWDILTGASIVPRCHATLQRPVITPLFSARQSEEVLARVANAFGKDLGGAFGATRAEDLAREASRGLYADERGGLVGTAAATDGARAPTFDEFWAEFAVRNVWVRPEIATAPSRRITVFPRSFLDPHRELRDGGLQTLLRPRAAGDPGYYPYELAVFQTQQLRDGRTANVPAMMELAGHWAGVSWATWAEVHPQTAAAAGVRDGASVAVVSEFGHIQVVVRVSAATPPGIVALPLGLGHEAGSTAGGVGANPNLLIVSELDAPGPPGLERSTRVKLIPT